MAAETLGEALIAIRGDLSGLDKTLSQAKETAQRTAADISSTLKNIGGGMADVGKKLSVGLTMPLLGAAGAAVKLSTDFNAAMANVATLIPGQAERIEALKAATSDLSVELGKAATEMADGLYQVISAFGDSADTISVLEINAKAAAAGVASVTDAVNLTSAVTKAYGDTSAEAVQNVSDLALLTVRLGQTTFPELAASIGRVTPLTKELGVSQEELFAVMATGTGVTGGAAEVSTQLRGVLQALMAPTGDMTTLMEELGYESGQAMLQELGLHGAISQIVDAARAAGVPLQDYISSIEGQTLALALAGPQSDTYIAKLAEMGKAAGTTDDAFKEQTEGINAAGFALAQAQQKIAQITRGLGDALAPAILDASELLEPFVGWIRDLVQRFTELDPETQKIILAVGGLAAAAGPLLVLLGAMATGIGVLVSPIGLAVAAIGGLVAAGVAVFAKWDEVSAFLTNLWDSIKAAASEKFASLKQSIVEPVKEAVQGILEWFSPSKLLDPLMDVAGRIAENLPGPLRWLYDQLVGHSIVPDMVNDIIAWMEELPEGMSAPTERAAKNVQGVLDDLKGDLILISKQSKVFGDSFDAAAETAKTLESAIVELLRQGLDPGDQRVQELKRRLDELNGALEGSTEAVQANQNAWTEWAEAFEAGIRSAFDQSRAEADAYVGWLEATGQATQANLLSWNLSLIRNFEGTRADLLDMIAEFYTRWSGKIGDLTDAEIAAIQGIVDQELAGLEARGEAQSAYAETLSLLSEQLLAEARKRDNELSELEKIQLERGRNAWAERLNAAAAYYSNLDNTRQEDEAKLSGLEQIQLERSHNAWTARLNAAADYYTNLDHQRQEDDGALSKLEEIQLERGRSAWAARYQAAASYYAEAEAQRQEDLKKQASYWRKFTSQVKEALEEVLSGNETVSEAISDLWDSVVASAAHRVSAQIKDAFDRAYTDVISGAKSASEAIKAAFAAITADVITLAILAVQQIIQAFTAAREAQKRVAEEARKLREEDLEWQERYHDLTEKGFVGSYQRVTRTLKEEYSYFFGLLHGTAIQTIEVVDEATKAWIRRMEALFDEFAEGITGALEEALGMGDAAEAFDAFSQGIKDQLKEQIISALVEGFLSSQVITQAVAPLLQAIDEAMQQATVGGVFDASAFETTIAPYVAELGNVLDSLSPAFQALFQVASRITDTLDGTGQYIIGEPGLGGTPIYFEPMATGGIVRSPTMALLAEANRPEAVIPLDRLGDFGGDTTIIVELDGKVIARGTAPYLSREIRVRTGMRG